MNEIKSVSIIGMGALGLLYGSHILQNDASSELDFVMDEGRYEKYKGQSFDCNGAEMNFTMTPSSAAVPADLVIVAVKYNALLDCIKTMKNSVGENTTIISVMNGIDSEEIIAESFGMDKVIYTVAQGMDAMKFGNKLSYSKMGELHIGITDEAHRVHFDRVKSYFNRVSMPYVAEDDIMHRLWSKFMLNVGVNQTCMVFETNYGGITAQGEARDICLKAMREVVALANAKGIKLDETDVKFYMDLMETLLPEGMPSMRQDGVSKRPSEVEMFAGTVIRMSEECGLKAPVNEFLYRKVKEIESAY